MDPLDCSKDQDRPYDVNELEIYGSAVNRSDDVNPTAGLLCQGPGINQDIEPQLFGLELPVGTGGVPVYLPPGGLSATPFATLMGRPVVPIEFASTLGTVGDIMLVDLGQYIAIDKGGIEEASSMHVQFLTDQMAFRWIYRIDGQPGWSSALTPANGSATQSPFIALATRS